MLSKASGLVVPMPTLPFEPKTTGNVAAAPFNELPNFRSPDGVVPLTGTLSIHQSSVLFAATAVVFQTLLRRRRLGDCCPGTPAVDAVVCWSSAPSVDVVAIPARVTAWRISVHVNCVAPVELDAVTTFDVSSRLSVRFSSDPSPRPRNVIAPSPSPQRLTPAAELTLRQPFATPAPLMYRASSTSTCAETDAQTSRARSPAPIKVAR